jgi:hypothetical protein
LASNAAAPETKKAAEASNLGGFHAEKLVKNA